MSMSSGFVTAGALSGPLTKQLLGGWQPAVSLRSGLEACYEHIARRLAEDRTLVRTQ